MREKEILSYPELNEDDSLSDGRFEIAISDLKNEVLCPRIVIIKNLVRNIGLKLINLSRTIILVDPNPVKDPEQGRISFDPVLVTRILVLVTINP